MNLVKNRMRRILGINFKLIARNCCNLFKPDYNVSNVNFEVLRVVVMKGHIFWAIMSGIPLTVNRLFEGTCRLNLQSRRENQARNQSSLL
jgi:hypothetical protein